MNDKVNKECDQDRARKVIIMRYVCSQLQELINLLYKRMDIFVAIFLVRNYILSLNSINIFSFTSMK